MQVKYAIGLLGGLVLAGTALAADSSHIEGLRQKYAGRITFQTPYAQRAVETYYIDCKSEDKRYLPLINLLFAKMSSLKDYNGERFAIYVDNRGEEVRIYDRVVKADGTVIHSQAAFEITKWGELRVLNIRKEAVLNSCFGSYGPIWRLPGDRAPAPPAAQRPDKLIDEFDKLNSRCRGGSGDDPKTHLACDERDPVEQKIKKAGWCWGPDNAAGYEKSWIACTKR